LRIDRNPVNLSKELHDLLPCQGGDMDLAGERNKFHAALDGLDHGEAVGLLRDPTLSIS